MNADPKGIAPVEGGCPFCGSISNTPISWVCKTSIAFADPGEDVYYHRTQRCYERQLAQQAELLRQVLEVVKLVAEGKCCSMHLDNKDGVKHLYKNKAQSLLPDIEKALEVVPPNPAACLACMGAPGVEHAHSGETNLNEFAVLRVRKSTMPPGASLVVCYEVGGVPVLADERYPEFVVVRRDDILGRR